MSDHFLSLHYLLFVGMWGNGYSFVDICKLQRDIANQDNE